MVIGDVLVRCGQYLSEQEDDGDEGTNDELEHLPILHNDHQPNKKETTKHLDKLPPEEVRLRAHARVLISEHSQASHMML